MNKLRSWLTGFFVILVLLIVLLGILLFVVNQVQQSVEQTTQKALSPLTEANNQLNTQVADLLHPTPTIIPDPTSIIHEVRSLARLETIQYSVEKVIRAEEGQESIPLLFGDKLIFVAHGTVIAGIDLEKLNDNDVKMDGKMLVVTLPQPEVFVTRLDNDRSYVYDRETGLFTKGDSNLETQARQIAEQEILKAAQEDNITDQARVNAENYLVRLFRILGYPDVRFTYREAEISPTPQP
ncbi:MAG: DUF4230 domain-containing protein [Anaerolineae bacterium]|nr:DUF4230 domain-containing protein [Anaerolineae bacterium]